MLTRGVLLMLILAKPTRAAFSMDITICDSEANQLWKREAPKVRDDIILIHECRIYSGKTSAQNVLSQCIKNVEAHITIPDSSKILRADFLSEELEWCTIREVLVTEGDGLIVKQSFDCQAYNPSAEDEFRAYLSCDPHFGHPVVILLLRPMRKVVIVPYVEAFFYGWCSSIAVSATILLLIIAYKPELVEIIHKQGSEGHVKSRKKKTSRENALAAAKLEARKKLLKSPRTSAGSSAKKQKPGRSNPAETKEKDKKYLAYSETKAKYLALKRRKKSNKKKAEKK